MSRDGDDLLYLLHRLDDLDSELTEDEIDEDALERGCEFPPDLARMGARILASTHGLRAYRLFGEAWAKQARERLGRTLRLPSTAEGRLRLFNYLIGLRDAEGQPRFVTAFRGLEELDDRTVEDTLRYWSSIGALDEIDI